MITAVILHSCSLIESVLVVFGLFWVVLARFGVVMARFGSFWVVLGSYGSFWLIPWFSKTASDQNSSVLSQSIPNICEYQLHLNDSRPRRQTSFKEISNTRAQVGPLQGAPYLHNRLLSSEIRKPSNFVGHDRNCSNSATICNF